MTELITGNTYPVRGELFALGGKWDAVAKGWRVPAERAQEARALVAPKRSSHRNFKTGGGASRYRSHLYVFAGGGEMYVNKNGRCEDAPCCGCCS